MGPRRVHRPGRRQDDALGRAAGGGGGRFETRPPCTRTRRRCPAAHVTTARVVLLQVRHHCPRVAGVTSLVTRSTVTRTWVRAPCSGAAGPPGGEPGAWASNTVPARRSAPVTGQRKQSPCMCKPLACRHSHLPGPCGSGELRQRPSARITGRCRLGQRRRQDERVSASWRRAGSPSAGAGRTRAFASRRASSSAALRRGAVSPAGLQRPCAPRRRRPGGWSFRHGRPLIWVNRSWSPSGWNVRARSHPR